MSNAVRAVYYAGNATGTIMVKSKRVDVKKKEVASLPKKKTPRRPDEVKARIIEAAISAFARQGFDGARMRAVAADAGISIQLLVHHVKSKDKLWRFMMEHIFEQYNQFMSTAMSARSPSTAAKRLKQAIADLAHFTATMPQLHRIVTAEAAHPTPRMLWLAERFGKQGFENWCSLIEEAQREGAVRNVSPARLRFAIVAMTAVPFAVAAEYEYFTGKSPFSKNEVAQMIDMVCEMVFIREV
jgi:TetR/AcrR family transcriptional regulator